ncbi:MAG: ferredoxin [Candidatus Aenigmatarchaeota archaeon]
MTKIYKVEYDRTNCIGAGICAALNPENFKINDDTKADFLEAKLNEKTGMWEREITEKELEKVMAAASGCPVLVIHITDKETGEKLI